MELKKLVRDARRPAPVSSEEIITAVRLFLHETLLPMIAKSIASDPAIDRTDEILTAIKGVRIEIPETDLAPIVSAVEKSVTDAVQKITQAMSGIEIPEQKEESPRPTKWRLFPVRNSRGKIIEIEAVAE